MINGLKNMLKSLFSQKEIRFDQMADQEELPEWNPKLYVVTRRDLSPGAQACQAIHAVCEFVKMHPEAYQKWYTESNYLAFLSVKDEDALYKYKIKADINHILFATFHEPDFGDELTAVVFDATIEARELLKNERSALKQNFMGRIKK